MFNQKQPGCTRLSVEAAEANGLSFLVEHVAAVLLEAPHELGSRFDCGLVAALVPQERILELDLGVSLGHGTVRFRFGLLLLLGNFPEHLEALAEAEVHHGIAIVPGHLEERAVKPAVSRLVTLLMTDATEEVGESTEV